jgi:hypothetical protein
MTITVCAVRLPGCLLCLSLILLLPASTNAQEVIFHTCGDGTKLGDKLASFADQTAVNTLVISGICDTSENPVSTGGTIHNPFFVAGFTNLTIRAGVGGATLSGPSDVCTPGEPAPSGGYVLSILNSSRVALENLQVTGGRGVQVSNSNVLTTTPQNFGNTVSGSRTTGFDVQNGGALNLKGVDVVTNSCQHGVSVIGNSSLISSATIQNNGEIGVKATAPASVSLNSGSKIHDNGTAGVHYSGPGRLVMALTEVYGNGQAPAGGLASNPGGVVGIWGAFVQTIASSIHDNAGPGVYLRLNATSALTNTTVQSNVGGGLNLYQGSVADLSSFGGVNVLNGNATGSIGDINCDAYSQVFGDVSAVASNKCPLQGNSK